MVPLSLFPRLLGARADVNAANPKGETPLHYGILGNNEVAAEVCGLCGAIALGPGGGAGDGGDGPLGARCRQMGRTDYE